ncbi:MAG: hypothetical protein Fues2KO_07150 [Fuerstiella sp.]
MTIPLRRLGVSLLLLAGLIVTSCSPAQADERDEVQPGFAPFIHILNGQQPTFTLSGDLQIRIDDKPQSIKLHLARDGAERFDLKLHHEDYAIEIYRRADFTAVFLPKHETACHAHGPVDETHSLAPSGLVNRLISPESRAYAVPALLDTLQADLSGPVVGLLQWPLRLQQREADGQWILSEDSPLQFPEHGQLKFTADFGTVHLTAKDTAKLAEQLPDVESVAQVDRNELERTLSRGIHRATEILIPGTQLQSPQQQHRKVPHGELRWIDGQRVALLDGTPEEIGTAHALLLKNEATRCIESVLYTFATAHLIRTGRWFRYDLRQAYDRLKPHIPERHLQETQALAAALEMPPETLEVLNVFPELFHCSGFAVFDSATSDGTLYHGRVLDYMTTIGLQDAATTFIVKPAKHHAFANVGYAAFIGSVSGMNDQAISLGEMGGRGEGQWDGVPMATLMRRALEECSTLEQVQQLWTDSPRTCEYYYVFADGKTNDAVGVAAWPDRIEFIKPGEAHERLGEGIPDAIVLSAGSRLEKLRERVRQEHGGIDTALALWLMNRPVAMESNLHNVLFIPKTGHFYVANASHSKPAAEMPYVKLHLPTLLDSIEHSNSTTTVDPAGD